MDGSSADILRIAAISFAFLAGLGTGAKIPSWQLDETSEPVVPAGVDSPLWCGYITAGCFAASLLWWLFSLIMRGSSWIYIAMAVTALAMAYLVWPPEIPEQFWQHPEVSVLLVLCQRWLFYTLGVLLAGIIIGGTLALQTTWFRK
jgi:hypothetical protein